VLLRRHSCICFPADEEPVVIVLYVSDLQSFPKLATPYVGLLHACFRSHIDIIIGLPSPAFMEVMRMLSEGLDSLNADIASLASASLDHLATFYVRNLKKDNASINKLRAHLSSNPMMFLTLMRLLFQIVVFGAIGNQWGLARPLLALMLAAEAVAPNVSYGCRTD
jgi:hypothetical protein